MMKKYRKYIVLLGILALLIVGYFIANSLLFDGVKPRPINENGFRANYFAKDGLKHKTAVILIGGGQWGDYWAQEFVRKEKVGLSIPYIGKDGLPRLPEEIDLKYFEDAINWLRAQPEVNPNKIIVMGASRNAELALLLAATFPEIVSGVIAYSPGSVSWSNTVLPYNSDELKSSWIYKGADIPYIPMEKITVGKNKKIEMLEYWVKGLNKTHLAEQAAIKVENIDGPILLFSGKDDKVWPSSQMADMIAQRLKENGFSYQFQNIKYDDAGHLISGNPDDHWSHKTGTISINGKNYEYEYGGSEEGDFKAKQDARTKVIEFLDNI